jgi:hypothetical protein
MEYLFRGKDIQTGEWIEGDRIETDEAVLIAPKDLWASSLENNHIEIEVRQVHPDTVGMWTGLEAEWFSFVANQSECKIWKDQLIDVTFAKDILPTLCRVTMSNGRWVCISVKDESKIESLYRVLKHLEYSLHR